MIVGPPKLPQRKLLCPFLPKLLVLLPLGCPPQVSEGQWEASIAPESEVRYIRELDATFLDGLKEGGLCV